MGEEVKKRVAEYDQAKKKFDMSRGLEVDNNSILPNYTIVQQPQSKIEEYPVQNKLKLSDLQKEQEEQQQEENDQTFDEFLKQRKEKAQDGPLHRMKHAMQVVKNGGFAGGLGKFNTVPINMSKSNQSQFFKKK